MTKTQPRPNVMARTRKHEELRPVPGKLMMVPRPERRIYQERMSSDDLEYFELTYPMPMTQDEISDFKEWLGIIQRKVERISAEAFTNLTPDPPKEED